MSTAARSDELIRTHLIKGQYSSGWKLGDAELHFLEEHCNSDMRTIETGAGASTIIFAKRGTTHTCITPSEDEVQQIRKHCQDHDISLDRVKFIIAPSEDVLPNLEERDFDLALLDGRHGFPAPFIDWFYISERLKVGGRIIVDDLHIWTPELLKQFLLAEPDWKLVQDNGRAAIFTMLNPGSTRKEWSKQVYTLRNSRITSWRHKLWYLVDLAKRGELGIIRHSVARKIRRPKAKQQ